MYWTLCRIYRDSDGLRKEKDALNRYDDYNDKNE